MKKIAFGAIAIIAAGVLIWACAPTRAARSYVFSVTSWGAEKKMKAMYRPLLDYIEENTGAHFDMVMFQDYETLIKQIEGGYVQFALVNPVSYMRLAGEGADIRYLVTSVREYDDGIERDHYLGYVVVLKKSPVKEFSDLRGRIFGFVDDSSASGYKMIRAYMADQGLDPKTFFKKYFFLGDHDEVLKAVKNGMVDAGATWEVSYKINVDRYGNIFRIIHTTPPIPNDAWIVGGDMPKSLADRIKQLLLKTDRLTAGAKGEMALNRKEGMLEVGFAERDRDFYMKAAPLLLYEENEAK